MSVLGQVRQTFAKALQIASDNSMFTELPDCSLLSTVRHISIKVQHLTDIVKVTCRYVETGDINFEINFLVRDEEMGKKCIMTATLTSGQGFTVSTTGGDHVMDVRLPNHSEEAIGKILHPSQATLYKILYGRQSGERRQYNVFKIGNQQIFLVVEKMPFSLYSVGKIFGLLETNCAYFFKRVDGTIIGECRPKLALSGRTISIKFGPRQSDVQSKAVVLGTTLLLLLHDVYPELKTVLQASLIDE
ncbi:hypothetical protein AB6A40_001614 [Gnathostoma spinigerum]|uniref:Phospholipid scramblase n=1 Tax=Gnathostoma spinigerum TaxID=75299 RepID=A0ABD6E5K7_9BILA